MMILSLICSVMFFLSAIILFMPKFRKYPFFKPFGVYMAYQGIWTLLSYIVNQLFPTNQVMTVFNYLGGFVFCIYFLFIFYVSRKGISKGKSKNSKSKGRSDKADAKSRKTSLSRQKEKASQKNNNKKNRYANPAKNDVSERYRDNPESLYIKKSASAENETTKTKADYDTNTVYGEYTEYGKKKNRFAENDKDSDKYTLSSEKEDIYEDSNSYDDFSIDDDISEDEELESINNIEITDEDLEYDEDEEDSSDAENTDDVDLYDSLDDDFFNLESDEEDELISDEDEYGDDLFSDYDDSEDEEEEEYPLPKRGRRYKK